MIGILGGNFALYGWLPAVATHYPNEKILIALRHKEKFDLRPELQQFVSRIEWVETPRDIIFKEPKVLILVIPPKCVEYYLESILHSKNIKTLIVEKPICETPEKSKQFIDKIEAKGINVFCPYIFIFNNWFWNLDQLLKEYNNVVTIDWFFKADHFKNNKDNWKRDHNQGGGPLRFYGIHLIACLEFLNYTCSKQSLDDACYMGVFTKENSSDIIIRINTRSDKTYFKINDLIDSQSPFDNSNKDMQDYRVFNLKAFLNYIKLYPKNFKKHTKKIIDLWKQVEEQI